MNLIGSTKSKIIKDKNGEDVPHLELAELVLIHCNLVKYICSKQISWQFIRNFTNKSYFFKKHLIQITRNKSLIYRSN